jgi:hypothetical protein
MEGEISFGSYWTNPHVCWKHLRQWNVAVYILFHSCFHAAVVTRTRYFNEREMGRERKKEK